MAEQGRLPIYVDSCVLIDMLGKGGRHQSAVQWIMEDAQKDRFLLVCSVLGITESLCRPALSEEIISKAQSFFAQSCFEFRPVTRPIAEAAAVLCRQHGLMHNDGLHMATCRQAGIGYLLTCDGESKVKRRKPAKMLALNNKLALRTGSMAVLTPGDFDNAMKSLYAPLLATPPAEEHKGPPLLGT